MDQRKIEIVQETYNKIHPISEDVARLFYTRLFELAPTVKPLFKGDLREQGQKLMQMIGVVVWSLDKMEKVLPGLEQLGVRHIDYGTTNEHYEVVGQALLETLAQCLGDDFTLATKEAWAETYMLMADTMKKAAAT